MVFSVGSESAEKAGAGSATDGELPGVAFGGVLVEGGKGGGDLETGDFLDGVGSSTDFVQGGAFGFVGDGEAGEVGEGWKLMLAAFFEESGGKLGKIGGEGRLDGEVVGLIGLNENFGVVEVTATDTTDDLGKELEGALFGGKIGETEAGIGLDDADGGEMGEVETTGEGLSADENLDFAGFYIIIRISELLGLFVVAIKTGNFGALEELFEFRFEEFGAETFVNNAGATTMGATGRDFFGVAADVTFEAVAVGVEDEGEMAVITEGLPTALFADGEGGGAAAIMKNQGLVAVLEVFGDGGEEGSAEITVLGELIAIFEVDEVDVGRFGGGFGFDVEADKSVFGLGEVEIGDTRGGAALEAGDFEGAGDEAGEAKSGIAGGIVLIIGGFVGFVDDDEAEVGDRGKKGGAGADDDFYVMRRVSARAYRVAACGFWGVACGFEEVEPGGAALDDGLVGVDEGDTIAESLFENLD